MEYPSLLVLDDPFIGRDKEGDADVRKFLLALEEKGKTVLLVSHSTESDKRPFVALIPRTASHFMLPQSPNIRNSPYWATFSCFCGSQSHVFSCKHETHDLLTLVSLYADNLYLKIDLLHILW